MSRSCGSAEAAQERLGAVLVALLFGLVAVLAWAAAPAFLSGDSPDANGQLASGATTLGLLTLLAYPRDSFTRRPTSREGGRLADHGTHWWKRLDAVPTKFPSADVLGRYVRRRILLSSRSQP
jgi:hypothetical protein